MNEIQKFENVEVVKTTLTEEEIKTLIKANIIPNGTPEPIIKLFARVCAEKNLSPFSRQIHLVPRRDSKTNTIRYTIQIGIDGLRAIAERTGKYAGSDDYIFDEGLTEFEMIKNGRLRPTTATATVYKILPNGTTFPIRATARWEEYYPGEKHGFIWDKMPFLMLGKVAEALALRKAFPDAIAGLYSDEEMQQAGESVEIIDDTKPKIENQTNDKISKEERQKLIDIANHPIFERSSNGVEKDRTIILKIASDPKLTRSKYAEVLDKCLNEIKKFETEFEKDKEFIKEKLLNDDKLASRIIDSPFPEQNDIDIFLQLMTPDDAKKIIEQINFYYNPAHEEYEELARNYEKEFNRLKEERRKLIEEMSNKQGEKQ